MSWPDLKDEVTNIIIGYYHSRLIFRFNLISVPKDIISIRKLRTRLEKKISAFLMDKVVPAMKAYAGNPRIFIYPVFEIQSGEPFWKFDKQTPYSLPTTCFYTNWKTLGMEDSVGCLIFYVPKELEYFQLAIS